MNNKYLDRYKQNSEFNNFRMYYNNTPTNLVYYDERIFFIPKKYLKLSNLISCENDFLEYELSSTEQNILDEIFESDLDFNIEENLKDLYLRLRKSGLSLSFWLSVTFADKNDYSKLNKPIYLGNQMWLNKE